MIMSKEIRATLTKLLKVKAGLPYEVHFDLNRESSKSYFYVEISERRKTVDPIYYDRRLRVSIQLILLPDEFNRVSRAELYDAEDRISSVLRPVLQIGDRFITVQDTSSRIFDGILHYEFELSFTDYLPAPNFPLMEELDMRLAAGKFTLKSEEEDKDGE